MFANIIMIVSFAVRMNNKPGFQFIQPQLSIFIPIKFVTVPNIGRRPGDRIPFQFENTQPLEVGQIHRQSCDEISSQGKHLGSRENDQFQSGDYSFRRRLTHIQIRQRARKRRKFSDRVPTDIKDFKLGECSELQVEEQ